MPDLMIIVGAERFIKGLEFGSISSKEKQFDGWEALTRVKSYISWTQLLSHSALALNANFSLLACLIITIDGTPRKLRGRTRGATYVAVGQRRDFRMQKWYTIWGSSGSSGPDKGSN